MTNNIYKAKQEWLERVMASSLTHAEKVFAFTIYTHMYGDKTVAFPATDDIMRAGGFTNRTHFPKYRQRLFDSGAMKGEAQRHKGRWENYTYELNLDWDGTVNQLSTNRDTSGNHRDTSGITDHDTSGYNHDTSGITNTTNNPTKGKTAKEDYEVEAVADAPTSPLTLTKEDSFDSINQELPLTLESMPPLLYKEQPVFGTKPAKSAMTPEVSRSEDTTHVQEMNMSLKEKMQQDRARLTPEQRQRYDNNVKMFGTGRRMTHAKAMEDALNYKFYGEAWA